VLVLADSPQTIHTPTMTIKTVASSPARDVLSNSSHGGGFHQDVTGVLHDVDPAMALLRWLIYLLASVAVTVCFSGFPEGTGVIV